MTAATVEIYIKGDSEFHPVELHFSHEEIMAGRVDDVIDDLYDNKHALMLCVRWHDHDWCEDPTTCRGNEPAGDDFYFFTGRDEQFRRGNAQGE